VHADEVRMNEFYQKSNEVFNNNIAWLLASDIRIINGQNKGALFGWKNLNPVSFPFIYSEITGYGITAFLWIYSVLGDTIALQAAKDASQWIIKNLRSYLLVARPSASDKSEEASDLYYAFDNAMIMIGLLNLHKITKEPEILKIAEQMGKTIVDRFFDGSKLIPRLDRRFNTLNESKSNGLVKWSTISGSYHSKLSIGLLELSRLTNNNLYKQVSDAICNYAISLQKSSGQFLTNPGSDITYLHPHLYACEGLIYSGLSQSIDSHYSAGLKGIMWAITQTLTNKRGGLGATTRKDSAEQSDCTAQLLRLLILCHSQIQNNIDVYKLDKVINKLHSRLLDFYISTGESQGGFRYHLDLDSVCSWCTMFSMQALHLWKSGNSETTEWIDYFV
jgi:hypothetical protein